MHDNLYGADSFVFSIGYLIIRLLIISIIKIDIRQNKNHDKKHIKYCIDINNHQLKEEVQALIL